MFTGIIEAVGKIVDIQSQRLDARVHVATLDLDMTDVQIGDSIAVNGTCLTAVEFTEKGFWADVSGETIEKTSFSNLRSGSLVNLEKALTPTTRLGGHLVSGHVDGVATIVSCEKSGNSLVFVLQSPADLAKYISKKGSVTIDGISLTVNEVKGCEFQLNIVPHTLDQTVMKDYHVGTTVNIEVDLLARYLERLMLGDDAAKSGGVNMSLLQDNGFFKK